MVICSQNLNSAKTIIITPVTTKYLVKVTFLLLMTEYNNKIIKFNNVNTILFCVLKGNKTFLNIKILTWNFLFKTESSGYTVLLYIMCRVGHYYGCIRFEFNDISFVNKKWFWGKTVGR